MISREGCILSAVSRMLEIFETVTEQQNDQHCDIEPSILYFASVLLFDISKKNTSNILIMVWLQILKIQQYAN